MSQESNNAEKKNIKVGIIGAMELEIQTLKAKIEDAKIIKKARMEFIEGRLSGTDVVLVRSGVGKVNAAACTQILADNYGVTHIINTGIAGSLNAQIDIGDIVVSTDVCHHDVNAVGFGYSLGEVPQLGTIYFQADENMKKTAEKTCTELNSDIKVFYGRVASGDQFICRQEDKDFIKNTFEAYCTEMEGAAIAQTAYLNEIPFIIIRAISDKADNSAQVDYPVFERRAAMHSAKFIEHFVKNLSK